MRGNRHNGNGHKQGHVTETPDVSHIKNLDVTHEASDVNIGGIAKFVIALTIMCVVVFLLMGGLFRFLGAQETEKEPPAGPMAMTELERLPPPPRLQAAKGFGVKLENGEWVNLEKREPEAEYRVLREQWEHDLKCTSANGLQIRQIGCMPIDEAMEKLLQGGGLAVRPANNAGKPADLAPTAWSSGRVSGESRRQ